MKIITILLTFLIPIFTFAQSYQLHKNIPVKSPVVTLTFSPNGTYLAGGLQDGSLIIWNTKTDSITTLKEHQKSLNRIVFTKNSQQLATASSDGTIKLWSLRDFTLKKTFNSNAIIPEIKDNKIMALCFSPNEEYLFFGGTSSRLFRCKNQAGASPEVVYETSYYNGRRTTVNHKITDIKIAPDQKHLLLCAGNIKRIPLATPTRIIEAFPRNSKTINTISLEDNQLAAWDASGRILLWKDHNLVHSIDTIYEATINVKGHYRPEIHFLNDWQLLSGSYGVSFMIWNTAMKRGVQQVKGHRRTVTTTVPSPDDIYIASGSLDKTIKIWTTRNLIEWAETVSMDSMLNIIKKEMKIFKEIEAFIPLKESLIGEAIPLIYFPKNSTTLEVEMTDKLEQLVQFLKANPKVVILLAGHTQVGQDNDENHITLSTKRAEIVKTYLVKEGIDKRRIQTRGFGDKYPILNNDTEENKKMNRRVELLIVEY